MAFGPVFGRTIRATFDPRAAAVAAVPWYLSGGIVSANCIAAYQPKGAASLAASLVNLITPGTNDAVDPGGAATPGWGALTGWTGNGTSQYIATTVSPLTSWSVFAQYASASGVGVLFGSRIIGNKDIWIHPTYTGNNVVYKMTNTVTVATGVASGNLGFAGTQGYRNGVADGTDLGSWSATPNYPFAIMARNVLGTVGAFLACNYYAISFYNTVISGDQITALYTAMAAL